MNFIHGDLYKCKRGSGEALVVINSAGNPCITGRGKADIRYWAGTDDTYNCGVEYAESIIESFVENILVPKDCWMDVFGVLHNKTKGDTT